VYERQMIDIVRIWEKGISGHIFISSEIQYLHPSQFLRPVLIAFSQMKLTVNP
jgi:hypothetical protein